MTSVTAATAASSVTTRLVQSIRNNPWKVLGVFGVGLSYGYRVQREEQKRLADLKKKKVLVLPFYKMKIVEEQSPTSALAALSRRRGGGGGSSSDAPIEIAVDDVVSLIHDAAQDPGIVGLYGVFGHGGTVNGGWAHLEEIRNALHVFANSHRQHKEPAFVVEVPPTSNVLAGTNSHPNADTTATSNKITTSTSTKSTSNSGDDNGENSDGTDNHGTDAVGRSGKSIDQRGTLSNVADLVGTMSQSAMMKTKSPRTKKAMYAYADTFASPSSTNMKDFYVASAFSKIHMQQNGDLNLFGLHATNTFFKEFLNKYGITVNVWKHGEYKNAANSFTHSKYTRDHFENVAGILLPMHQYVCNSIYSSRYKYLKKYDDTSKGDGADFWDMVTRAGSLPSKVAHQIGFIDYMPRMDPLDVLLKHNKQQNGESSNSDNNNESSSEDDSTLQDGSGDRTNLVESWKFETDFDHFSADSKISLSEYARRRKVERAKESTMWTEYRRISESTGIMRSIYAIMGYSAPYYNVPKEKYSASNVMGVKEKIAVIKINGAIMESTARKAEKALRSVKEQKDIKCVVLRVDSPGGSINACESIYQQIQDLPQKVVVSFGNVSASGGYYISANADRIFASPTTITGSIGVFMLRVDIRNLAMRYGITFDSIPTSPLSGSFDPTSPVNPTMEDNFAISSDRAYHRFKLLVSNGRNMDMDAVEAVAKGRVWTGEQAKEVGLVDELGGLQRAVAYAQRECTTTGHAQVVSWPPKKGIYQMLMQQFQDSDDNEKIVDTIGLSDMGWTVLSNRFGGGSMSPAGVGGDKPLVSSSAEVLANLSTALPTTSNIMLTADENTAIQIALEENGVDLPPSVRRGVWDF